MTTSQQPRPARRANASGTATAHADVSTAHDRVRARRHGPHNAPPRKHIPDFKPPVADWRNPQFVLGLAAKLVIVMFAGAGGSCTGIEKAIGRHVDYAINHNENALSCHQANHPQTQHLIESVWAVNPYVLTGGRLVGYMHFSPDCTHFSQAKGGQPRSKAIRALPWVTVKWCGTVRPEVFTLENVKQARSWGPLIAKRDKATGRVVKLDGTVAKKGERVPIQEQFLIPDPKRLGKTWRKYCSILRKMGYVIEDRVLCAADYDVPQQRNRLFQIGRCDGRPIVWPDPVNAKQPEKVQRAKRGADGKPLKPLAKWRGAHECIDWSISGTSIFNRKRPLAKSTLRRIARGLDKFVLNEADPFIVPVTHTASGDRVRSIRDPLPAVTTAKGGELAVAMPMIVPATHRDDSNRCRDVRDTLPTLTCANRGELMVATAYVAKFRGESPGSSMKEPLHTITGGGNTVRPAGAAHAMAQVTAYLAQMNGGFNDVRGTPGHDLRDPMSTANTRGSAQMLVAATLAQLRNNCDGRSLRDPLQVVSAGGEHHALVSAALVTNTAGHSGSDLRDAMPTVTTGGQQMLVEFHLSPEHEEGALRCAAFLLEAQDRGHEVHTMSRQQLLALVTVWVAGVPNVIFDICIRMLTPRELANASSLPPQYILSHGHDGRVFSKSQQVFFIGNCVPPELQYRVTAANYQDFYEPARERKAA